MAEVENSKKSLVKFEHVSQTALTALIGFILSVFLILISLIILVRFWVFENVFYNLFVFSYFIIGVIFNIAAVNLTLNEYPTSQHILPFVVLSPVTFFWTIFCIILPIFKGDFFSQFAQLPIASYDSGFYDGLGYNPNNTKIHPFARPFISENSLFENTFVMIILLVILAIIQVVFWFNTIAFYYTIKKEEIKLMKIDIDEQKER